MINQLLTMETKAPFTAHDPYLIECREKLLTGYREARADLYPGPDSFELGLLYMATARAYFQGSHRFLPSVSGGSLTVLLVAFKRFTDMVPMMIDQELLRGLDWDRGLNSALNKGLGITGPGSLEKAKEYLQEPPDVRSRRENLVRRYERLLSAKRELLSI